MLIIKIINQLHLIALIKMVKNKKLFLKQIKLI